MAEEIQHQLRCKRSQPLMEMFISQVELEIQVAQILLQYLTSLAPPKAHPTCLQHNSDMQLEIDTYISKGEATFSILLLMDSSEFWEPTTLILKRSGYQIKDNNSQDTLIAEKFSKDILMKIPIGLSTQFVLACSTGSSYLLNMYNDVRMRDTLVLTMRMFQSKTVVLLFRRRWLVFRAIALVVDPGVAAGGHPKWWNPRLGF
ncbi:hypothetical protein RHGRI_019408 [Rhododendron griersonianum]|uniref:DUF7046 domain-containing protein n=1 Tax=Rhododendron griersonianum TaxID=479676 RepID=A0AAV6JFD9_9ERIC|nr:hypothetical protein RHGRI_019408 [Rhododendron griersonianum]